MSTIFLDVLHLEEPIYFDHVSRELFDPNDSEFDRLLRDRDLTIEALEKCNVAIRLMDAGHCTWLDPFPNIEAAFAWLRDHIDMPHVYVDGTLRNPKKSLKKRKRGAIELLYNFLLAHPKVLYTPILFFL